MEEVSIKITGTFMKIEETDVFVRVDLQGMAEFSGINGNYTVQGSNFKIEEHIKQGE